MCPSLSLDDITIVWQAVAPITDGQYFGFDNPEGDNGLAAGFDQAPFYSEPEPEPDTGDTEQEGEQGEQDNEQGTGQGETAEPVVTMALDSAENVLPHLQTVAPQTKAKPRTPRRPKSENKRRTKKAKEE